MDIKVITDVQVTIRLNYEQAKALDAMAGYGAEAFIKAFKEKLGAHYITPYEEGIKSLFSEIRTSNKPIQKAIYECENLNRKIGEINKIEAEARKKV